MAATRFANLQLENAQLAEQLAQCQADKQFVWMLWKTVQSESPEKASLVNLVVTREKEKADRRVKKLRGVIEEREQKIAELNEVVALQEEQLLAYQTQISRRDAAVSFSPKDAQLLQEQVEQLQLQLNEQLQKNSQLSQKKQELVEAHSHNEALQQQLAELTSKFDELTREHQTQIEAHQAQFKQLSDGQQAAQHLHDSLTNQLQQHKKKSSQWQKRCHHYEQQLREKNEKVALVEQQLGESLRATQSNAEQYVQRLRQLESECDRLQSVAQSTQRLHASEMESLKKVSHVNEHSPSAALPLPFSSAIVKMSPETLVNTASVFSNKAAEETEHRLQNVIEQQQAHLSDCLKELRHSQTLRHSSTQTDGHSEKNDSHFDQRSSCLVASNRSSADLVEELHLARDELGALHDVVQVKAEEIEVLRAAHQRRLSRIRQLQKDQQLLLEQLKTYDSQENNGYPLNSRSESHITEHKDLTSSQALQQEDNPDTVWNELTRYRCQTHLLQTQCLQLEEERDSLQAAAAEQASTIAELRACLTIEQQGLQNLLDRTRQESTMSCMVDRDVQTAPQHHCDGQDTPSQQIEDLQEKLLSCQEQNDRLCKEKRTQDEAIFTLEEELCELRAKLLVTNTATNQFVSREINDESGGEMRVTMQDAATNTAEDDQKNVTDVTRSVHVRSQKSFAVDEAQPVVVPAIPAARIWVCSMCQQKQHRVRRNSSASESCDSGRRKRSKSLPPGLFLQRSSEQNRTFQRSFSEDEGVFSGGSTRSRDCQQFSSRRVRHSHSPAAKGSLPVAFGRHFQPLGRCSSHGGTGCRSCREQLHFCRARVTSLQQQVTSVRRSRDDTHLQLKHYVLREKELEESLSVLRADLNHSRQEVKKLAGELQSERSVTMNLKLTETPCKASPAADKETVRRHEEADKRLKLLVQREKTLLADCSRQSHTVRVLKEQLLCQANLLQESQDRCKRLERDLSRKQQLVQDLRRQLDDVRMSQQKELGELREVSRRHSAQMEAYGQVKVKVAILKHSVEAESRAKTDARRSLHLCQAQLQQKTKQVAHLEQLLKQSRTAREQLQRQEEKNTAVWEREKEETHRVVTVLTQRLETAREELTQFRVFVKGLCVHIEERQSAVRKVQHSERSSFAEQKNSLSEFEQGGASWEKARQLSCSILKMSSAELDEFMGNMTDSDEVDRQSGHPKDSEDEIDCSWLEEVHRVLKQPDFAPSLLTLFGRRLHEILPS